VAGLPLQAELDAAAKQVQQMQEEQERQQKQAAESLAAAVEQHGLELQRLSVERSKLVVGGASLPGAAGGRRLALCLQVAAHCSL
jgi:hypothetical protein